ncbi:MAG: oligosaccharide flippase family protein [Clostridia bacterium]|nr:oligosaccharide flippase family protein [Clostridia bacterium]
MNAGKTKTRFFTGVLALTIGNFLVKILGLALKVPLRNLMGDGGMAYYNNAYDIYASLFLIATAGLPSAIAILISESRVSGRRREAKRVFRIAMLIFLAAGLAGTLVMVIGAPLFEKAYKITDLRYTIMAIGPTMLFICLASAFRGYFQSYQNMYPTSISEIIEAVGKFALGILFGTVAFRRGEPPHIIAAYAAAGITAGVLLGMLYLWVTRVFFRPEKYDVYSDIEPDDFSKKRGEIALALLSIALPISLSSSVTGFEAVLDGMILSRRIQQAGFAEQVSNALIGNYRTCAVPLYNLPLAFVGPIGASVIPVIAAAVAEGDRKKANDVTGGSIILLSLILLPCAFGLGLLSSPIIQLLFGSGKNAENAAPLLSILCCSLLLNGLVSLTSTILHANRCMKEPLISTLCGAIVKIVAVYVLAGIRDVNIYAGPVSSFVFVVTALSMNFFYLYKKTGFSPRDLTGVLLRALASSAICGGVSFGIYTLLSRYIGIRLSVVAAILIAIPVYIAAAVLLRTVRRRDLMLLPKGEKIVSFMERHGLVRD